MAKLNLDVIQHYISTKKINVSEKIDINLLKKIKLLNKKTQKIKILGKGELKDKITIEVDFASNSAKEKLAKNGSSIKIKK